jgi:hypothetical protein
MNIEEKIREQRTFEATAKNLMGMEGKFYLIARFLGDAITNQSTDQTFLDTDELWEEDEMPSFSEDDIFSDIGYIYNGLSNGIHLEIICKENEGTIKAYFEGYLYYEEEQGILNRYVPYERLEKYIENLYSKVEEKVKYIIKKEKPIQDKKIKKMEFDEIRKLREKWGDVI